MVACTTRAPATSWCDRLALTPSSSARSLEEIREVFEGKLNVPHNKLGSAELGEAGDKASEIEVRTDKIEGEGVPRIFERLGRKLSRYEEEIIV